MKTFLFLVYVSCCLFFALDQAVKDHFNNAMNILAAIIPAAIVYIFYAIRR